MVMTALTSGGNTSSGSVVGSVVAGGSVGSGVGGSVAGGSVDVGGSVAAGGAAHALNTSASSMIRLKRVETFLGMGFFLLSPIVDFGVEWNGTFAHRTWIPLYGSVTSFKDACGEPVK